MESNRAQIAGRPLAADGYLLVEAIVGVVLLGVGALGVAAALGQAEQFAAIAVQRDREADIRADLVAALAMGSPISAGWLPTAEMPCWTRVTDVAEDFVWVEARCGAGLSDLPADTREPGLLVRR